MSGFSTKKTLTLSAVLGFLMLMVLAPAASAQNDYSNPTTPQESPPVVENDGQDRSEVLGEEVERSTEVLPVTGGDIIGLAVIGLGAAASGTAVVAASRRRKHQA